MGSIKLDCPLCCCLSFTSSQTLRDHLSPFIWDSLPCAVCGDHFYGIQQLWFHLEEHISSVGTSPCVSDSPNIDVCQIEEPSDTLYLPDRLECDTIAKCETECIDLNLISCGDGKIILEDQQLIAEKKFFKEWTIGSGDTHSIEGFEAQNSGGTKGSDAFLCGICNQTMPSVSAIHNHALSEHGISHIVVPASGVSSCSPSNEEAASHSSQNLNSTEDLHDCKTNACDQCEKHFQSQDELLWHQKAAHQKYVNFVKKSNCLKYECSECKKYFRTAKLLAEHKERLHLKIKTCLCPQCGITFYDQHGLRAHMKTHDINKRFSCEHCNKQFVWAADLRRHEGKHTGKMTHMCEVCGKGYLNGYQLNVHIRTHTGDRPFTCTICGAAFMSKSNLRSHKIIHNTNSGDNIYACKYCSKTFPNRIKLYHHHRMHTKPFKCSSCGHGFTCTRDLEQHMRTHTKDYTCRTCGVQFTQAAKLLKHESTHEKKGT